ncbi:MAG: hypothetical protein L0Y72_01810 [Gemmataceae bacterium]|nr:hypothetical protein [Gemmataceae bacterium]MCI0737751.1 hypothetical protein [Gemmataceae bacterium]
MTRMIFSARVGDDGVLRVTVPVGIQDADQEVQVTVEPVAKKTMTQKEWEAWVQSMAGSITDPSFRRHEQGEYEERKA